MKLNRFHLLTVISALFFTGAFLPVRAEQYLETTDFEINFGYMPQNAVGRQSIWIKSIADNEIEINRIDTYCPCLKVEPARRKLNPGDSCRVFIELSTEHYTGNKQWFPRIYIWPNILVASIDVEATIVSEPEKLSPIYVSPPIIVASQYGDKGARKFEFAIKNKSDRNIPLKLYSFEPGFYKIDLPSYVKPKSETMGKIELTEKGYISDFANSITFEFVNETSDSVIYSIPVLRKLYRASGNDR
jgi:hypothetical protein